MDRRTVTLLLLLLGCWISAASCQQPIIKDPAVAGSFYPGDAATLQKSVDAMLSSVRVTGDETPPLALVVPHAAHQYSGLVASEGYARVKGRRVSTVILIGPSHYAMLKGAAIHPGDGMRTPLGVVSLDTALARTLASDAGHVRLDAAPFAKEHSLEVQLPFIQRAFGPSTRIVPILVGMPDRESYQSLSAGIAAILKSRPDALLLISTDLSHYRDLTTASSMDSRVIDAIERLAVTELEQLLSSGRGEMCGGWPTVYGLAAVRAAGASHAVTYRRGTSADLTGDRKSVVGYVAQGIIRGNLSESQRRELLELAKLTVETHVRGEKLPEVKDRSPLLRAARGVFVTIKRQDGQLRGCIGSILPQHPLQEAVVHNARAAASQDSRFMPVKPTELLGLQYEVTILSHLEPLSDTNAIVVGTHGVYLEKGAHSSVFLPQVPVEQGWDRATYLAELARKAGLPPDGWKDARLSVFTADIIK